MDQNPLQTLLNLQQLSDPSAPSSHPAREGSERTEGEALRAPGVAPTPTPSTEEAQAAAKKLNQLLEWGGLRHSTESSAPPLQRPHAPHSSEPHPSHPRAPDSNSHAPGPSPRFTSWGPRLIQLKETLQQELEANPLKLRTLNMSRRESLALHLERISGHPIHAPHPPASPDSMGGLMRWIEGPRNPAQTQALRAYFEEIALLVLGQALLLKSWSDRGIRPWSQADLGQLNWTLCSALRPLLPLDREGWAITRQNIYSWYNPSPALQTLIWQTLSDLPPDDPQHPGLSFLFGPARQCRYPNASAAPEGYDARFFEAIWQHCRSFGAQTTADLGPLKRTRFTFSPTLRDGKMVRTGPEAMTWIGLENSLFLLLAAELAQLTAGPIAPPLWTSGNGLETHSRDQLQFALNSPKPSLLSRITEIEACEVAFVLEEKIVRTQARSLDAQKLREQLETLPYFKKLKSPGTSLGDLQACVALSKLRPGGLLWWAREEPLSTQEGDGVLHFLLERGKLIADWDFSELRSAFPSSLPLFPQHLYLWAREPQVEERLGHHPFRVSLQGTVKNPAEMPLIYAEALGVFHRDPASALSSLHWSVHVHRSPTPQKDWMERWPDPATHQHMRALEKMRNLSLPMASAVMVKNTPQGDSKREGAWSVHASMKGLWIRSESDTEGRRLHVEMLPKPGQEAKGTGFMILVPDENWVEPLLCYLKTPYVHAWLDHHAERKNDRWILNEQTVRFIPLPKTLLAALGFAAAHSPEELLSAHLPLPPEWEKIANEMVHQPQVGLSALAQLQTQPRTDGHESDASASIRSKLFVRAARALVHLQMGQGKLLTVISNDGKIKWRPLIEILPPHEMVQLTFHPSVRIVGQLPPYMAIGKYDRIRMPSTGVLLSTELGMHLQIFSESHLVLDMIWDQLEGLAHPTWSELIQYIKLPRRLDLAQTTANDILQSHSEQTHRMNELSRLVSHCRLFPDDLLRGYS